jgi:predicted glycosyltransferase
LVLARDYGCTVALAEEYDLPYRVYGRCDTTKRSLIRNLPEQYLRSFYLGLQFDPDLVFGMGAYAAHTSAITDAHTVLVLDSEPTTLDHQVSKPFADALLTPNSFRRDLGPRQYRFRGFKESAYLHPDTFTQDESIRERLGVGSDRFVILRLNAFGSHHDVAHGGFSHVEVRELVDVLSEEATVFISDEGDDIDIASTAARPFDIHPTQLHDALAEAALVIADTQTVVTEAALLGTPVIRSNSFVGDEDMGNFIELEERGLVRNIGPFSEVRNTAVDLLRDQEATQRWESRRQALFSETVNLTELLVDVAENPHALEQIDGLSSEPPGAHRITDASSHLG